MKPFNAPVILGTFIQAPFLRVPLLLVLLAAPAIASETPTTQALRQLVAEFERQELARNPIEAGREGDLDALSRWPDRSRNAIEEQHADDRRFFERLQAIDQGELNEVDRVNHVLLDYLLGSRVELAPFEQLRMPFTSDSSFWSLPLQIARSTRVADAAQAEAWLKRIEAIPLWLAQNTAWMAEGIEDGFVQPASVVEGAVQRLEAILGLPMDRHPLTAPLRNLPDALDRAEGDALRARAIAVLQSSVLPAYAELQTFFTDDYLEEPRPSTSLSDLPQGRPLYRALVRYHTTLDTTPEAIHQLGLEEVARIRGEMDEVIAETGFEGKFADFVDMLRTDSRFYAQSERELIMHAAWIAKRADDAMPSLFTRLPRLPYGVRPVPSEIAPTYTTGRYWGGNLDNGVAGGFMVNTHRLDQRPLYALPALTLHEGVPGHHHQFALAAEMEDLPRFRRNLYLTAFGEGWGLYAERLGLDMGIYTTPYEHFGRLSYEMWRACRLVVDTGIHYFGWSREQAEACLLENSALAPHNVSTEVTRYVSWPGQALAYKPGEILIRDLRERAEDALGTAFDLRRFHDHILSDGAIPLTELEGKMTRWIQAESKKLDQTRVNAP